MSFETVARVTAAVLHHADVNSALFTWHGGEPTLLPLDFYRFALAAQARLKRDDQRIGNAIQTNGTLLNDELCQFLADNRFYVGVSIDGPRSLQDVQRPFISGRGSSDTVHRGIRLLKEWGIEHGILMVIDCAAIELGPKALFDFILTLGIKKVGFNAARPTNDPTFFERPGALRQSSVAHYTNERENTAFLLGLYEECERNKGANIQIRELESLRHRINGGDAHLCTLAGACIGKHFVIEPNGDFAHCDLFLGDPAYTFGNIYQSDFKTIVQSEAIVRLHRIEEGSQQRMSTCPYYKVCNGGCPHDRYVAMRYDSKYSEGCCGQRDLIAGLIERMRLREPNPAEATAMGGSHLRQEQAPL
jgi:uncharacterized protein